MTEPWMMPETDFWGQLDGAILHDKFRASEQEEQRGQFIMVGIRPLTPAEVAAVGEMFHTIFAAQMLFAEAFKQTLGPAMQKMVELITSLDKPSPQPVQQLRRSSNSQPRTLHAALAVNARPLHRTNSNRLSRSPATRRR